MSWIGDQEQPGARHHRQFAAQPGNYLIDACALRQRLQGDEDLPGVGLTAATATARAGETDHVLHGRVVLHDIHQLRQLALHRLERDALIGLQAADHPAGILLRKEALRHHHVQHDIQSDGDQQHQHTSPP